MKATNLPDETEGLTLLEAVCQTLTKGGSPKTAFTDALNTLREKADFSRNFVALYHAPNEKLQLFATSGMTIAEFRRLEARIDKSFISQVFQSGKVVVIPRTRLESSFKFVFENHGEIETSCVCVPIVLANRTIGACGVELAYEPERNYEKITKFLSILGIMMAQTVKAERAIALEKERLQAEQSQFNQELREKYDFKRLIGNSSAMRVVYSQMAQVARSNTPILLRGESGTGKELIANAVHYNSLRAKKAFVKVNCAALPESLIDTEIFGAESAAFAKNEKVKKGRFDAAQEGTLFLDEITALPLATQAKLLRVIEDREFERVGGDVSLKANVRIVAATSKKLEEAVAKNEFREDLFYRLGVFTIFLPPLRERKADILLLAEHFVEKYEREHHKHIKRISTPAIDMLTSYHFPGNVRELENVVERAVLMCDEHVIHGHHLPPTLQTAEVTGTVSRVALETAVESFERDLIQDALKSTRGNCAKAAKMLESTERILNYKIKKYGIEPRRFK